MRLAVPARSLRIANAATASRATGSPTSLSRARASTRSSAPLRTTRPRARLALRRSTSRHASASEKVRMRLRERAGRLRGELASECFGDQDHATAVLDVVPRDVASRNDSRAQGFEVSGRDELVLTTAGAPPLPASFPQPRSVTGKRRTRLPSAARSQIRPTRRPEAPRSCRGSRAACECTVRVRQQRRRQPDSRRLNGGRVRKTGIDIAQGLKRSDHEGRAHHQHQRKRHLHDDQRAARRATLPARARATRGQRVGRVDVERMLQRRDRAERERRRDRDGHGECEHGRIDPDLPKARQVAGTDGHEYLQPEVGQRQSEHAADCTDVALSTSNSRAIRALPAPSAARTASSCRRASVRTSMRFAMLAHATSSTAPIAPMSTHSVLATPPTKSSFNG